jgi:hypothetical protein
MFEEMKEAGLTKIEMVYEVLGAVCVFALPIALMFVPELVK